MDLFYHPDIATRGNHILNEEESRHVIRSKRYRDGDILSFTDGKGNFAKASLTIPSKKSAVIHVHEFEKRSRNKALLTVAISPLKSPARWEWFIEKATELGVARIQPLLCERTEKSNHKEERLRKIMVSAMKQSQRCFLPELSKAKSMKDFIDEKWSDQNFIAHCAVGRKIGLAETLKPERSVHVLVGPEGDFTNPEIEFAIERGAEPVSLGSFRLRTETAGLVVCQNFNFVNRI